MVRAQSCSFRRTIKERLWQSLRWWPPHHCSVPPLPPATLFSLILELHWNTSPTPIPPINLHSYHCHYQPAPCAIYRSTTRAHHAPHTFHVSGQSYRACTSSRGHGSWSPQGLVRIWVSILWHPSEYKSFCYMFHSKPYALLTISLYVYVLLCINTPVCCLYFASSNINLATYFSYTAGTGWCFPQKNPFLDMFCGF